MSARSSLCMWELTSIYLVRGIYQTSRQPLGISADRAVIHHYYVSSHSYFPSTKDFIAEGKRKGHTSN
jgi:hypothetical protein